MTLNFFLEVTYTTEALAMTDRKTREGMKLMGLDPASAKCRAKCLAGAASHGPEARAVCERDLATAQEWLSKVGKLSLNIVKLRRGSGKDWLGMASKSKGLKA